MIREDQVRYALGSYKDLQSVVNTLSVQELMAALTLESRAMRREAVLKRLIRRLVHMREQQFREKLTKRFMK